MRKISTIAFAMSFAFGLGTATFNIADAASPTSSYSKPSGMSGFRSADRLPSAPAYSKPAPSASIAPPVTNSYSKPSAAPTIVASPTTNSYSKPGTTPTATSNNGYTKPVASSTPAPAYTPRVYDPKNALSASSSKVMSNDALAAYKAERAAAKTPPQPVDIGAVKHDPAFNAATKQYGSVDSYMNARKGTVNVYRNNHPDVYIYSSHMAPNYGAYDDSFLLGMTLGYLGSSASNNAWMYSHMNDPWYAQWHADMLAQAQTNDDLRAKIEAQDAELARLKASGVQPTPVALPAGIDPSLAIAPEAMIANASVDQEDSSSHIFRNIIIVFVLLIIGFIGFLYMKGRKS